MLQLSQAAAQDLRSDLFGGVAARATPCVFGLRGYSPLIRDAPGRAKSSHGGCFPRIAERAQALLTLREMTERSPSILKPGDVLEGKYVLRSHLGGGGMGSVFLAEHSALQRTVAIKILHPELTVYPENLHRIRDEAIAACHVRSPHCVAVFDYGALPDGTPYLVMEHVPGRPLGRLIAEEDLPLPRAMDLFDQILSALGATHDSGLVHADVKSDNFLVELTDEGDHVTMIDFGLSHTLGMPSGIELEDGERVVSGTPEYMAPEILRGAPALRSSDLYGAGVILYELLTGSMPFCGESATETALRHASEEVVPPSVRRPDRELSPALDRLVLRALAKEPEERFRDAATFSRALHAAAGLSRRAPARPGRPIRAIPPMLGRRRRAISSPAALARRRASAPPTEPSARRGEPPPDDEVHPRRRLARASDCGTGDGAPTTLVMIPDLDDREAPPELDERGAPPWASGHAGGAAARPGGRQAPRLGRAVR